jgi:hypothetical protein
MACIRVRVLCHGVGADVHMVGETIADRRDKQPDTHRVELIKESQKLRDQRGSMVVWNS